MAFGFTGYLLPWDQKAYWATAVGTNMAGTVPGVGAFLVALLRGGAQLGTATLARFYAFHVLWLPLALATLVGVHLVLVIRQGIAPRPQALERGAPARTTDPGYPAYYREAYGATKHAGVRFWPDIVGKDVIMSLGVVGMIMLLALTRGAPLEPPADPTDESYLPRPEWYFLPLYQLLKLVPGSLESLVVVGVPVALLLALIALPIFDRRSARNLLHRPAGLAALLLVLGGSGLLMGLSLRGVGPAAPPEIGRPLTSAARAGRALFQSQQCQGCHLVAGKGGSVGPDLTDVGLRHSPGWIHSFIEMPTRFHPQSRMPAYGPPVLSHQEIEELSQYLTALRGREGQRMTQQLVDTFPEPPKPK